MPKFKKGKKDSGLKAALEAGPGFSAVHTKAAPAAMPVEKAPARSTAAMKKRMGGR